MWEGHPAKREELTGLAAQLALLKPRAQLDRDRLMFAAGRRSALARLSLANGVMLATNVLCGGVLATMLAFAHFSDLSHISPTSVATSPGRAAGTQDGGANESSGPGSVPRTFNVDRSTNVNLLREITQNNELPHIAPRTDAMLPLPDGDSLRNNYSRAVLNQYLEGKSSRL